MVDQNVVELRWILAVIRRWWWLITGAALLAAIVAYAVTAIMPAVYQSSALMLVNPSKNSNESQYNDLMAGTQLALTYSKMLKDRTVLENVITDLGLKKSADALAKQITAEPVSNSQIIKLTVEDSNADRAALIANTLALAFTKRVQELSTQRYAVAITSAKNQMDDLQGQIKDLQAQNDSIRAQKVTKDVALADRQTSLTTLQNNYQSLQNGYQALQLTMAQVNGKVFVVEPVQVQKNVLANTNTATVVVSAGQVPSSTNNQPGDSIAYTYAQLLIKPPLLLGVINKLNLTETADQLAKMISYEVVDGTQMIRIKVENADENKAQLIAQSLADAFATQVRAMLVEPYSDQLASMQKQLDDMQASITNSQIEIGKLTSDIALLASNLDRLDTDLAALRSDYRDALQNYAQLQKTAAETSDAVIITEPAQAPKLPSQNRMLYLALAAMLGLAIGGGSSFLLEYIHGKIQTSQDVHSTLNVSVLSTIGKLSKEDNDLIMISAPASNVAEDFRVLTNKIRLIQAHSPITTLLVTSPVPSEGKSFVVSNLAISLAKIGLRVALVDADLRLPRLHTLFGKSQNKGLMTSMVDGSLNGSLQLTEVSGLKILTTGEIPPNPAEVLHSDFLIQLLEELKRKADLILIDCPPLLAAADASILASKVDGVLLVLKAGYSESGAARDAVEALRQVKANLIGIVLNCVPDQKTSYYRYYYKTR